MKFNVSNGFIVEEEIDFYMKTRINLKKVYFFILFI